MELLASWVTNKRQICGIEAKPCLFLVTHVESESDSVTSVGLVATADPYH